MDTFDIGETVICSCEVRDELGALTDPTTSMKITITDKFGVKKVDSQSMLGGNPPVEDTGKYHYDCQTTTYTDGKYQVNFIATDGTRITIEKDTFTLE